MFGRLASFVHVSGLALAALFLLMLCACGGTKSSTSNPGSNPGGGGNSGSSSPSTSSGNSGGSASNGGSSGGSGGSSGGAGAASHLLFCGQDSGSNLYSARIDPNSGTVTLVNSAPVGTPGETATVRIAVTPNGQFVYDSVAALHGGGQALGTSGIGEFSVGRDSGNLSPLQGSPVLTKLGGDFLIHPNGRFAYHVLTQDAVDIYSINSDGTLSQTAASQGPSPGSERGAISADGKFFLRPNNNQVFVDSIDANSGSLTTVAGSPFVFTSESGAAVNDVIVDPSSHFVYISGGVGGPGMPESGRLWAAQFSASTGAVTPAVSSESLGANVYSLAITPNGHTVFAADALNSGGSEIHAFAVNSNTGALAEIAGSPVNPGMNNAWIAMDAGGKFLFVTGDSGTRTYSLGSDGSLQLAQSSSQPQCIAPVTSP